MAFHHETIRKYTAALLNLFNDIEIQYTTSDNNTIIKKIPLKYSTREKTKELDEHTVKQLLSGNTNVLPRASMSLVTLIKSDQRQTNKNRKLNKYKTDLDIQYSFNSIPYEFTYELNIQCRGMNEATQIIEQIAPNFNPIVNIDVWDASNLDEPTRVPVKLLDIGIETEAYEELSANIVTLTFGLSLTGNLYQPIKSIPRIKEFQILLNEIDGETANRKEIMDWDVNFDGFIENGTVSEISNDGIYNPPVYTPPKTLKFITETLSVLGDAITLTYIPKDDVIFNFNTVRYTDISGNTFDIPVTQVQENVFSLLPETPNEYDGKEVIIQYAYIG